MRVYSDKLTFSDINSPVPAGMYFESIQFNSRKAAHGYEVHMAVEPGTDAHGIKRCYSRNSGVYGANSDYTKAPTWVEWGDLMVQWFKVDPQAEIGPYKGVNDFGAQTFNVAANRPKHENAVAHQQRWEDELIAANDDL